MHLHKFTCSDELNQLLEPLMGVL